MISTGWKYIFLDELICKKTASVQTGPFGTVLNASEYVEYGTPIISVREIRNGFIQIFNETPYVSDNTIKKIPQYILRHNDLVFARKGSVERCALIPSNNTYFLGSDAIRIRFISNEIDPVFMLYCFHSFYVKNYLIQNSYGTTMAGLNEKILSQVPVLSPIDVKEQIAIAEALSDTDNLIASLEKLIAKKKAIKQGAMQELLTGKKRLLGFKDKWENSTLGCCLSKIVGGGTPSRANPDFWQGNIPWATVKDFATFDKRRTQEYITKLGLENSATHLIPKGVPITSTRMGLGRIVIYDIDVSINQDLKALFVSDECDIGFIVQWFAFNNKLIESLGTGSTVKGIRIEQLTELPIVLPKKEEQTTIASILSDMDTEIEQLEKKLGKYRLIKQGMMQELLTGRIRLLDEQKPAAMPVAKAAKKSRSGHSEGYRDAVILVALVNAFGTEQHPFTAFDCQKFPYLFHRHLEGEAKGYKEFAAGPYDPAIKYKTARPIATKKKYIQEHTGCYKGFVADANVQEALTYFDKWYGEEPLKWMEQFRYIPKRKDELELLTTVDMAMVKLRKKNIAITMSAVKDYIRKSKEWQKKLKRELFSDDNISRAIQWSYKLFGKED